MGHGAWDYAVGGWRSASLEVGGSWQKSPAFAKATARQADGTRGLPRNLPFLNRHAVATCWHVSKSPVDGH